MSREAFISNIKDKLRKQSKQFYIQLGHPVADISVSVGTELRAVFPAVFDANSEAAYLFWHQVPIRFHYAYALFWNYEALIAMIQQLQKEHTGTHIFTLQTELLVSQWELGWQNDALKIKSQWTAKSAYDPLANYLNQKETVLVSKTQFLNEWHGILRQTKNVLDQTTFSDQRLQTILTKIEGVGRLYQV